MDWLTLLEEDVKRTGSKAKTALKLGISRPAVSLALLGRYPASTKKLEAKVLKLLADRVHCPFDGTDIARGECQTRAAALMPQSSPAEFRAWSACQSCPNNPKELSDAE